MSRTRAAWPIALWRLHTGSPIAVLLSLVSVAVVIQSGVSTYSNQVSPAWNDIWNWPPAYQRWLDGTYGPQEFLAPYYEHRIVLTKLLVLADCVFDGMNGRIETATSFGMLAGLGWLIWRMTRLGEGAQPRDQLPPLFWVALLISMAQFETLDVPFQVQTPIACFASGTACFLLARATLIQGTRAAVPAAAAALAGIIAAFSFASGVLLAPSLVVMLALRRARPIVWVAFVPLSALGLLLFFSDHNRVIEGGPALLNWHLAMMRVVYSCNFIAAGLGAYSGIATWAGAAGLALFGVVCAALARTYLLRGCPVPAADAALVALGLMVVLCAPAGTLTNRLLFGTQAALASRYATMSLIFAAALLGLALRWSARSHPGLVARCVVPLLGLIGLSLVNAPTYLAQAAGLHRVVLADTQLRVNNVGAEGRTFPIFLGTVDTVRADITILHAHKLNMFSGSYGPPADLVAALEHADPATLPACHGFVDHAYAIDATAVMVAGWIADPAGRDSAPWVAALDAAGHVLGTAPSLEGRADVGAALGMAREAQGFAAGFRLRDAGAPGETRTLRLVGLFPGAPAPVCGLAVPARIGPLPIEPALRLAGLAAAPASATPEVSGADALRGVLRDAAGPVPGGAASWGFLALGRRNAAATLVFHLAPGLGAGRALAVPFFTTGPDATQRIAITLADGTRLETELPWLWTQAGWRAVVVPPGLLALHGGATSVEVRASGQAWLAVASPLAVTLDDEWSRLF